MANTVIQLKYSEVTTTPPSLNTSEPAYSNTSGKLFIGDSNGNAIAIGGEYYTNIIDSSSSSATPSTLVLRDNNGSVTANQFIGDLVGSADSADQLTTARDIGLNGDATGNVSFDGSQNVTLTTTLSSTGVVAATYGGATQIPTFTVDAKGRLTAAANVAISTNLNITADTGANTVSLADDTLAFVGGDGITTTIDPSNNVKFDVDNTVIRTTGDQAIVGDFEITGNLVVSGNTISIDSEVLRVNDSIILLANNNVDDLVDIGFTAHYGTNGDLHTGLVRHAQDKFWYLFQDYDEHFIHGTNTIDPTDPTFNVATLVANITGGTVSNLTSAITVTDGGTGATTFTSGGIVIGNGTGSLQVLANTTSTGSYGNASHTVAFTVDEYGRVSAAANTPISIDTAQIGSGTLSIARGGTNQTSFTTGSLVAFDGTSLTSFANSTYTLTGGLAAGNTVTSITVDDYGRLTAVTGAEINIDASQIGTGTIAVARGGTGNTSFTQNGVLIGQGTNAVTTAFSSTEGHVLQINASGVPVFDHLNGGSF